MSNMYKKKSVSFRESACFATPKRHPSLFLPLSHSFFFRLTFILDTFKPENILENTNTIKKDRENVAFFLLLRSDESDLK